MKNPAKTGKSARRGNAPSPYTKYQKRPYRYGQEEKKERRSRSPFRRKR